MSSFASRLNKAMELRNMKQSELVEKTGITKGAISQYLKGKYAPKQINTYKIAKALNVNPVWLLGKDVSMELVIIKTIAAHHDSEDWTEEELQSIEDYKAFIRSRRNR